MLWEYWVTPAYAISPKGKFGATLPHYFVPLADLPLELPKAVSALTHSLVDALGLRDMLVRGLRTLQSTSGRN